jgi:hypothetical protein
MKKTHVFGLALLLTATAWGSDVSGAWTGKLVLDTGNTMSAYVHLKQKGDVVTGTQGPSEDNQFPITTGRIDGERLVIEAKPGPAILRLSMKLNGNKLVGDVFEDERKIGTVSLRKAAR